MPDARLTSAMGCYRCLRVIATNGHFMVMMRVVSCFTIGAMWELSSIVLHREHVVENNRLLFDAGVVCENYRVS